MEDVEKNTKIGLTFIVVFLVLLILWILGVRAEDKAPKPVVLEAIEPMSMAQLVGGTSLRVNWVQNPSDHGGTVEIDSQGTGVFYTPGPAFEGIDTFRYTSIDTTNGEISEETAVEVEVYENTTPAANAGDDRSLRLRWYEMFRSVRLDGSGSLDIDGSIVKYEWGTTSYSPDPEDAVITRVRLRKGWHVFTLRVQDNEGDWSAVDTVAIQIRR